MVNREEEFEEEKDDDFEDKLEENQKEVVKEADEGELLALRKVLSIRKEWRMNKERTYSIPIVQFKGKYVMWLLMEEAVQI